MVDITMNFTTTIWENVFFELFPSIVSKQIPVPGQNLRFRRKKRAMLDGDDLL